ncbi:Ldh family oxidoreductase [Rhodococcus opacus]|uniref:Ldh family oxidoreductase n=1 Tax=Rhodococcus opacus TaxID=37919 RepID=UPI002474E844|nr:Ldh family oxidoreductase [Rhodococcus opacus]MDH6291357.1 (2R)-3-sulfolactate dehydrogenase (NADP+) [Rhodococcus opacus]
MIDTAHSARTLAADLLQAAGLRRDRADITAECIVQADLWGIASHGLLRLPFYLERMLAGGYPPNAELVPVRDTGPVIALDGGGGLGHWQLWHAAEIAAQRCAEVGIAAVSVGNSGHCGALGIYTRPALDAGYLCLAFSNGPAVMPPWGGGTPLLSTSPIAAGVPSKPTPAIIDLATSAVARGKIAAHAQNGEPLPDGWALNAEGAPTTDPHEALRGMLAPLGGAKGFALALLVEAFAGGAVGPHLSVDVPDMFDPTVAAKPQQIGHLIITIDPACLDSTGGSAHDRIDRLARLVGEHGGRVPGERRVPIRDLPPETPIELAPATIEQLTEWTRRLDITVAPTAGHPATHPDRRSPVDVVGEFLDSELT